MSRGYCVCDYMDVFLMVYLFLCGRHVLCVSCVCYAVAMLLCSIKGMVFTIDHCGIAVVCFM